MTNEIFLSLTFDLQYPNLKMAFYFNYVMLVILCYSPPFQSLICQSTVKVRILNLTFPQKIKGKPFVQEQNKGANCAAMLFPSSGTGQFAANSAKIIRFVRKGCTNRPFYHIVVAEVL